MKQEDKELLLKDLCARLPYGVICNDNRHGDSRVALIDINLSSKAISVYYWDFDEYGDIEYCKPYLRPMSSMTEEEKKELLNRLPKCWGLEIDKLGDLYFDIRDASYPDIELLTDIIDWLNKKMFDYRGLIGKGLALEALEGMYK